MAIKKNKKKKKKVSNWKKRGRPAGESFNHLPVWKQIYYKATQNNYTEEERSVVAKKASMMTAMRAFTNDLTVHLHKCNTNLGLMLDTRSSVVGSLTLEGTGENGATEFVPVKMTVHIGNIQDRDTHIKTITDEYGGGREHEKKELYCDQAS